MTPKSKSQSICQQSFSMHTPSNEVWMPRGINTFDVLFIYKYVCSYVWWAVYLRCNQCWHSIRGFATIIIINNILTLQHKRQSFDSLRRRSNKTMNLMQCVCMYVMYFEHIHFLSFALYFLFIPHHAMELLLLMFLSDLSVKSTLPNTHTNKRTHTVCLFEFNRFYL